MLFNILSVILMILGSFFAFLLLNDLPQRGNLKIYKTLFLTVAICLAFGFGIHFLFLSLGV